MCSVPYPGATDLNRNAPEQTPRTYKAIVVLVLVTVMMVAVIVCFFAVIGALDILDSFFVFCFSITAPGT